MGSGKTTAARVLARALKYHLVEENFGENAFLSRFYSDMKRWAFHSQTFFLMEKITQMLETKNQLQRHAIVQDTPIQQDAFSYAKAQHVLGNIDDAEWRLYMKIYASFEQDFPIPDCIVYLETSTLEVGKRIQKRGRGYEQKIPVSYLELLDMLNHKWLSQNTTIPVIVVETDALNIVTSVKARDTLVTAVKKKMRI